jgi:sulfide:quinone oxidoreductase
MSTHAARSENTQDSAPLRVVVVGGGVAALETALALHQLAPELTEVTVVAPNSEFVYRPMTVREPFAYGPARRYPLEMLVREAGAELIDDELASIESRKQMISTRSSREIEYDALVLALGAKVVPRYTHALTIDDRQLDETLHGLIEDIEGGYTKRIAFISPGRMAWPLPLYELALMTAGRAYDGGAELSITIVTPEDAPLAIFGSAVSNAVGDLLRQSRIETINSAYAEVPETGRLVINPGDRHLEVERVVALPELYGPSVRGISLGQHGFIRVDRHGRTRDAGPIYAAGDATDFPVKHGGVAAQQADAVAESIAALAGSGITPRPFHPVIRGMLLTAEEPLYMSAQITGGHGFSSEVSHTPTWAPVAKIAARYLAPVLERIDRQTVPAR